MARFRRSLVVLGALNTMLKSLFVTSGSVLVTVVVTGVVVVRVDLVVVVIVEDGGVIVPSGMSTLVPFPGNVDVKEVVLPPTPPLVFVPEDDGDKVWLVSELLTGRMVFP